MCVLVVDGDSVLPSPLRTVRATCHRSLLPKITGLLVWNVPVRDSTGVGFHRTPVDLLYLGTVPFMLCFQAFFR